MIAIATAVGAYAYWTASGTGTGTSTAGTDSGVTVTGDPANGVYPGGSVAVTSVITNGSSTSAQFVTNLHVTISIDSAHSLAGCLASWFTYKSDGESNGTDSNPHSTAVSTPRSPLAERRRSRATCSWPTRTRTRMRARVRRSTSRARGQQHLEVGAARLQEAS